MSGLPADLDSAVALVIESMTDRDKDHALLREEEDFLSWYSLAALGMRELWLQWGSELVDWFARHGITHPDDMSTIVLTCVHRDLNKKPRDLEMQIASAQAYWLREKGTALP